MTKLITAIFRPFFRRILLARINNPETKDAVLALINQKVDLPDMDEATERMLFEQIYSVLEEYLKKILN